MLEPANTTLACPIDVKGTEDEYVTRSLKNLWLFMVFATWSARVIRKMR